MKKALVFISNNDYMGIEEAINRSREGYEIFFLLCDSSVRGCNVCRTCNNATCWLCVYQMKKLIRELVPSNVVYHVDQISKLLTVEDLTLAANFNLDYNDVATLKNITFQGVEIGYGAFSTFVTYTRNVMPSFNETLKGYLNRLMQSEIKLTLVLERFIESVKPDLIVFHNGRFSNLKPAYNLAQRYGIDFVATEQGYSSSGEVMKNNFFNEIPHSFEAINKKIETAWLNVGEKGPKIGKEFFENRRNAKPAGDKVYAKDQIQGKLPDGFDKTKRNISIFNSSEDEFFAISKEYDNSVLFPNQYIALKTIFEHYQKDDSVHFYLRIHPNLKNVPWKSHTLLYELKYPNVTIIPPTSPISSYTLMDASEKVIVFNSTMGLESSYWGKAVIALSRSFYSYQELVYEPKNEDELYKLIDNENLSTLRKEINCYKAACYCMGYATESYINFKILRSLRKHGVYEISILKFWGSSLLYAYLYKVLHAIPQKMGKYRKFASKTA